jgi:hypothetical protein
MQNLLTIERAFLSIPAVKQGLKLAEFKTLQRNVENAQKKKFDTTLELSKVVLNAFNWFKSTEGQALCSEEGISWNAEDFGLKVFGFQKSYFYKLTRAGKLDDQVIVDFKLKCTELESAGESPNRSLEGLLKYAKDLENANSGGGNEGEIGGEGEAKEGENEPQVSVRPQVIYSFEYKIENIKIQVLSDGSVKLSEGVTPEIAKGLLKSMINVL